MCWFQGEDDKSLPRLNRMCIKKWRELNPACEVNVLSNDTIGDYVPEYFEIDNKAPANHPYAKKSNLLRLLLLSKYGGTWVDASVYPMLSLEDIHREVVNEIGFFTYRFFPRNIRGLLSGWRGRRSGNRETVSWFLVAEKPGNYLVEKWKESYINFYLNNTEWKYYFQFHTLLAGLYDTDDKVKHIIDNMIQIHEKIPNSATRDPLENRQKSYVYKRPSRNHLRDIIENELHKKGIEMGHELTTDLATQKGWW
jgi:hypothetical protein